MVKMEATALKRKIEKKTEGPSKLYCKSRKKGHGRKENKEIDGAEIVQNPKTGITRVETGKLIRETLETERSGDLFKKISRGWG